MLDGAQAGPQPPLVLKIDSNPGQIASARAAVELLAGRCGFDDTSRGEIGLCVNEALANVIRHAYNGATDKPISLEAVCGQAELTIKIRDWGNGINPMDLPPREHDPLKPGGVGMICLKKLMHQVEFAQQPDGMLLTMTRRRTGAAPSCDGQCG